jgi:hypothetical protein
MLYKRCEMRHASRLRVGMINCGAVNNTRDLLKALVTRGLFNFLVNPVRLEDKYEI